MTLDEIREAAEAKYGSLEIEVGERTVRLLNPLRLAKAKRDQIRALQDEIKDENADQVEIFRNVIRIAAESTVGAELLIEAVGEDLALLATIFTEYGKKSKVGEASA